MTIDFYYIGAAALIQGPCLLTLFVSNAALIQVNTLRKDVPINIIQLAWLACNKPDRYS